MKKKIFFVSYGGGHSRLLIPIIKKIQEEGVYEFEVLALTAAAADYRDANIPFYGMTKIMEVLGDELARNLGVSLASDVSHPSVSREESIAYLGLSYRELVLENGQEKALDLYKKYGRQSFLPIQLMQAWLRLINPDLVVSTSAPRMERAALEASSFLHIPSLCLVDLFCIAEYKWVGQKNFATKIGVLSSSVKNFLVEKGRPEQDIEVTGNPAFHSLSTIDKKGCRKSIRSIEKWENKFVILWAVCDEPPINFHTGKTGYLNLNQSLVKLLGQISEKKSHWKFIIRQHPSMCTVIKDFPGCIDVDRNKYQLTSLLPAVDCVITTGSTVGLEAAMLGVPVISLKMSNMYSGAPYDQYGCALGVEDLDGIEEALFQIEGRVWKPLMTDIQPNDSIQRILRIIKSLCNV